MKILFISPHIHSFRHTHGGSEQRTYLFLKALASFAEVDFVAFHDAEGFDEIPNINILFAKETVGNSAPNSKLAKWLPVLKFWDKTAMFPVNKNKEKIVNKFTKTTNYDFIFAHYIPKMMECGLLNFSEKLMLDVDDLPQDYFRLMSDVSASKSGKIRYLLLSKIAVFHTKNIIRKISQMSFPNPENAVKFGGNYVPNIPFYESTCPPVNFQITPKRLFFIGNLLYEPNFEGISYFLKHIYLPLTQRITDVEFYIGGSFNPNGNLRENWEQYPNVKVLGNVDDLRAEYEQARVAVVPVYQGAGTNIKVVEALQMNRACVVSATATRGFSTFLEDKKDYLVAKNDDEFVNSLVKLLTDENLNIQIAENGCQKVKAYFSFEAFKEKVKEMCRQKSDDDVTGWNKY